MKPSQILPKLIIPILLLTPIIVVLLVGALACNVVLYVQAKQEIAHQRGTIKELRLKMEKTEEGKLKHGYIYRRGHRKGDNMDTKCT